MNNEKFYAFIREIAKEDLTLAESIIEGHKMIFENETETLEEGLREKIGAGLLGASLAFAPATMAKDHGNNRDSVDKIEYIQQENNSDAIKAVATAKKEAIDFVKEELIAKGDPSKVIKSIDFAKKRYKEIKNKYGERHAITFLHNLNRFLNMAGITQINENNI